MKRIFALISGNNCVQNKAHFKKPTMRREKPRVGDIFAKLYYPNTITQVAMRSNCFIFKTYSRGYYFTSYFNIGAVFYRHLQKHTNFLGAIANH